MESLDVSTVVLDFALFLRDGTVTKSVELLQVGLANKVFFIETMDYNLFLLSVKIRDVGFQSK